MWQTHIKCNAKHYPEGTKLSYNPLRVIWDECKRRYPDLPTKPIKLRMEQWDQLTVYEIRIHIEKKILEKEWPKCIKTGT